jgi:hypothetical protein
VVVFRYAPLSSSWLEKLQNGHHIDANHVADEFEDTCHFSSETDAAISASNLQLELSRLEGLGVQKAKQGR